MPPINYSKIPKVLNEIEFHTSSDPDFDPYQLKMTRACLTALEKANDIVIMEELLGAQKIRNFIRQYPQIPMFKNHLWRYYVKKGYMEEANDVALFTIKENPTYFYGRLMLVNTMLMISGPQRLILEVMQNWNIVTYAGRNEFAYHEVMNYYSCQLLPPER